jgi:hypothetical protein
LKNQQGRLRFHPRSIINEIILPVVKDYRSDFERGAFPPEMFLGYSPTKISADLTAEVSQKESDQERRTQFLYLFQFWGDRPDRVSKASVPAGVFQSFGLSPLDEHANSVKPETLEPIVSGDGDRPKHVIDALPIETLKPAAAQEPIAIRQFLEKIAAWRGGSILGQNDANRIRGWINTHILYSVNWEAELLRSVKPATDTYARRIYLPKAKGNPPDQGKAFIVVAQDTEFEDSSIADKVFFAIRAMLRYDHYNGWNYKDADNDYVALSNFVDTHLPPATWWIRLRYKNLDATPVPALAQSLLWQARQLNVESAHRVDDANQLDAVFADAPQKGERDDDQPWNEFLDAMSSKRKLLIEELLERIAAFQGTGKTPHAVDASQLLGSIQEFRQNWEIDEKFPQPSSSATDELKRIYEHISTLNRSGVGKVKERQKRIAEQSKLIVAELGKDYDKNDLLKDVEEVCALTEQHGLKGEVTVGQLRKLMGSFKDARVKEAGEQVEAIVSGDHLGSQMSAIAKLDIKTHALLVEFSETCSKFLKERLGKAEGQIVTWTDEVVESKKESVDEILKELEAATEPYREANA